MANDRHQSNEARMVHGNAAAEFLQCAVEGAGRFTVGRYDESAPDDRIVERHAAIADERVFAPGDVYESVFEQN